MSPDQRVMQDFSSSETSIRSHLKKQTRGTWVAQSVKRLTLDFGLGHDLTVVRSNLVLGSVLGMEPA